MLHSPVLSEGGSCCSEGGLRPLIRVCLFVPGCGVFCSVFEEVAGREVRAGIAAKGEGPRSSVRPVSCSCGCAFGFGGSVMQCIVWGVIRQVRVGVWYVFSVWEFYEGEGRAFFEGLMLAVCYMVSGQGSEVM